MTRNINPFGLRLPPDLRDKLEVSANANRRSMNAELVLRLQKSVGDEPIMIPSVNEDGASYLTDADKKLLELFRRQDEKKQRAVLELLK